MKCQCISRLIQPRNKSRVNHSLHPALPSNLIGNGSAKERLSSPRRDNGKSAKATARWGQIGTKERAGVKVERAEIFHSSRTTPRESGIKLSVRRTFDSNEKFSSLSTSSASTITFIFATLIYRRYTITLAASSYSIGIGAKGAITSISRRHSSVYTIALHIRITQSRAHAVNAAS